MTSRSILILRCVLGVAIAVVTGFLAMAMVFTDLYPGEGDTSRTAKTGAVLLVGGFASGVLFGRRLWPLAALSSWGPVLLGLASLRAGLDRLFTLVLPPLLVSLVGGYASILVTRIILRFRKPRTT